jgi:hypothetical protein
MASSIVTLTVEDSSFNAKIKAAAKAFADFGSNVASAGADAFQKFASGASTAKVAFQGFNTVLKANALVFVATLAVQVGAAIGEMIGDWISGANDAEAAQRRLNDELDRTAQVVKGILADSDFNARIAKAAGKSTTEILKMKYEAADAAYNKAMSALFDPNVKVGTKEYDKAKQIFDQAEKARTKAWQDIQVDKTAREHQTGEYAVRGGGGGGSSRTTKQFDVSKIAFNPTSDESLKFNPEEHAVASGLRPEDILGPSDEWEKYKDTITESIGSIGESMSNLTEWTEDFDPFQEQMDKVTKAAKQQKMAMGLASQAVSAFGAAMSSIGDPGAKAAGIVMQSLASIALGFAQAAAAKDTTASGWAWLGWVAAGLAAMATSIAMVHNLTGFAQGGIVEGNSYSGDNIPIMANAGEVVLTKAMQGNLASSLQGNGMQNMNIAGRIKGTDIILSIDRSLKLEGKQLLTWGR